MWVPGVGATLTYDIAAPAVIAWQIAAAGRAGGEALDATLDGTPVGITEVAGSGGPLGGRTHLVACGPGQLVVTYTSNGPSPAPRPAAPTGLDRIVAMRPSRYCPSDRLGGYAARYRRADELATVRAIVADVHHSLTYDAAATGPTTDAIDTLLAGRGVCRDYAHLTAALCRAVGVPARVAAVYAPGLDPMDFHLVAETALGDEWLVWDATRLAPRQSLVRVATGRDAADVAFGTVLSGTAVLVDMAVTAVTDGDLPADDHEAVVELP
ncbi:transglutaminase family protein [Actinoplanes sp. KI2]|uniref:transglutaminase-like domain-containing protein n=1 Tax=Actinoplanes sp. KI2 TaxID=2983315 RepID=UPI0021D5EB79|nr:transglutaminase family protein [Actinoplanes sp. KI2]MCU7723894.1 transglutaminase family protein [Actinoplanes sp. KI2]